MLKYPLTQYNEVLTEHQLFTSTLLPDLSKLENIEHCMDGIYTELGELLDTYKRHRYYKTELDVVNLKEEVGDVLWYVNNIFWLRGIQFFGFLQGTLDEDGIVHSYLIEYPYNGTENQKIRHVIELGRMFYRDTTSMRVALMCLIKLSEDLGVSIKDACTANRLKLEKRYKDKVFNAEHAINRDVVEERKELEK